MRTTILVLVILAMIIMVNTAVGTNDVYAADQNTNIQPLLDKAGLFIHVRYLLGKEFVFYYAYDPSLGYPSDNTFIKRGIVYGKITAIEIDPSECLIIHSTINSIDGDELKRLYFDGHSWGAEGYREFDGHLIRCNYNGKLELLPKR
jgi:hypothetical protein